MHPFIEELNTLLVRASMSPAAFIRATRRKEFSPSQATLRRVMAGSEELSFNVFYYLRETATENGMRVIYSPTDFYNDWSKTWTTR